MSLKNRTNEFQAIVRSYKSKSTAFHNKESLSSSDSKSEFTLSALLVSQQINQTTSKLEELARLSRKKSLFDDDPHKVDDLTLKIKQKIASINLELGKLRSTNSSNNYKRNQLDEHKNSVLSQLQARLADTSLVFKDVLETRTQNIKSAYSKKEKFYPTANNSYNNIKDDEEQDSNDYLSLDLSSVRLQQTQLLEDNTNLEYMNQRSNAITSIERTIQELGGVFQQLAHMVSEQREVVQRIDANIENVDVNVGYAQRELLKYYASISSNRGLILKIFLSVLIFFVVFIMVK